MRERMYLIIPSNKTISKLSMDWQKI